MESDGVFEEGRKLRKGDHVGSIAGGPVRIRVGFQKKAVAAGGHGRPYEKGNECPVAAGVVSRSSGALDGMGAVKNDRIGKLGHDRQGAKVHDKVVVAEGRPPFAKKDAIVSCLADFLGGGSHVFGGHELALLEMDGAPRASGRLEKIGLTAEEGRNLQDVEDRGGVGNLVRSVNVRENRKGVAGSDLGEHIESFFFSDPPKAFSGSSVRLVVGGFEDDGDLEGIPDLGNPVGHLQGMGPAFDHAGAQDEEGGLALPHKKCWGPLRSDGHGTCPSKGLHRCHRPVGELR